MINVMTNMVEYRRTESRRQPAIGSTHNPTFNIERSQEMRSKKYTDDQIVFATKNGKVVDLSGQRFTRLSVLGYAGRSRWWCECDCGNKIKARGSHLKDKSTSSCGCLNSELIGNRSRKHDLSFTKVYAAHCNARTRCTNKNFPAYANYGAMNVEYKFSSAQELFEEIGHAPGPEYSIDRISPEGSYEKGNVRWATIDEQSVNKRDTLKVTIDGVTKPLITWCQESGVSYKTAWKRIDNGDWCNFCAVFVAPNAARCTHKESLEEAV